MNIRESLSLQYAIMSLGMMFGSVVSYTRGPGTAFALSLFLFFAIVLYRKIYNLGPNNE